MRHARTLCSTALLLVCSLAATVGASAATLPAAPTATDSFDAGILHVDRYGNGAQSLILIPGLGSGPWVWYGTIAHFAPTYTIYAITLPGFDGRPATREAPLFKAFADSFWAMLATHDIEQPVVIGHSLGGTLAILLGEQHPQLLRGIVALDGLPVFPTLARKTPQERAAQAAQVAASISSLDANASLAYETRYMQTIGLRDTTLVAPVAALQAKSDPKAVAAWAQEDLATDLRPGLHDVTTPLLEIVPYDPTIGAKANFTKADAVAFYRTLLDGAPDARVEAIAPARHFAMLDRPDAFYAAVEGFLAALPAQ